MSDKIVTITIQNGESTVDLDGFHGKGCKEIAKLFEQMGKVKNEVTKPAYNEGPGAGNTISSGR